MKKFRYSHHSAFKTLILSCWIILIIMLIQRDVMIDHMDIQTKQTLLQAETEEFQSIYFRDNKIGYVATSYHQQEDNSWLLQQTAEMSLNIANHIQNIKLQLDATLNRDNSLQSFTFNFESPFYRMAASGSVDNNTVNYTLNTTTNTIKDSFSFKAPPLLATTRRSYLLDDNMKKGDKRKIPWFDPVSLTGKESILEYRGVESILINGRVLKLHRFIETFSGVRVNSWLNNEGIVIKEESPAGFVFLREPKFKALSGRKKGKDILSEVAVKIIGKMVNPDSKTIHYRITFPQDIDFDLTGNNQKLRDGILTVTRPELPLISSSMTCKETNKNLESSPYIQTDNLEIQEISKTIIGKDDNTLSQVKKIGSWVYTNIEKRSVIGLPDALTTLHSRQGDCNEHAALFAAISRATGIPTRIVAGVTFHNNAFYYHAWNEVCLGNSWIAIDTTINQFPADATHIRFIEGEIQEQIKVGALLGNLTIEPIHPNNL